MHPASLDGSRSRGPPRVLRGRALPGRGARPVRRRGRRVAKLRRRRRQHQVLAARPDRRRQLRRSGGRLALAVGRRGARPRWAARAAPAPRHPDVPGDAADGGGRPLHLDGAAPGGGHRRRDRRDDLGARPAGLSGRKSHPLLQLARGRLVERRRRRPHLLRHPRGVPDRPRRRHRRAGARVRRQRARRPDGGHPTRRPWTHESARPQPDGGGVAAHRRPRRGRHAERHLRRGHRQGGAAGVDQGGGRAHGRRAVGLPHGAAGGRLRRRHLGRRVVALLGEHQRVAADERRRGAGLRVPADGHPDRRLLRRAPAGRQPVRGERGRPRHRDRPADVALPGGAPRRLGLRLPRRPQPRRRRRRGPGPARSGQSRR